MGSVHSSLSSLRAYESRPNRRKMRFEGKGKRGEGGWDEGDTV